MKKFIVYLFLFLGLLLIYNPVLAQSKIKIPALETFLYWFMRIGVMACLGAILFGGIRFLLSLGNPQAIKEAKNWIVGGFLGLLLVLGSLSIYQQIKNEPPRFEVTPPPPANVTPIPKGPGVYEYSTENCQGVIGGGKIKSAEIINGKVEEGVGETQTTPQEEKKTIKKLKEFAFVAVWDDNTCKLYSQPGCYNFDRPPEYLRVFDINRDASGSIFLYRRPYFLGKYYTLEDIKEIKTFELSDLKINDGHCGSLYAPPYHCFNSLKTSAPYSLVVFNERGQCEIFEVEAYRNIPTMVSTAKSVTYTLSQGNLRLLRLFSQSRPKEIIVIPSAVPITEPLQKELEEPQEPKK
jgi:hypothetical protein